MKNNFIIIIYIFLMILKRLKYVYFWKKIKIILFKKFKILKYFSKIFQEYSIKSAIQKW